MRFSQRRAGYFIGDSAKTRVAQGVSGFVKEKGSLHQFIVRRVVTRARSDASQPYLQSGLGHAFQDMGVKSVSELRKRADNGVLRFELRTASAQIEGGVHGLES